MAKKQKRQRCEVYSRIVGYLRPVDSWNDAKFSEWEDRIDYKLKNNRE